MKADQEFYCIEHRIERKTIEESKIVPYIINNKTQKKKLLKNIEESFNPDKDIQRKDNRKQYTINLNPTTYIIPFERMINLGEEKKLNIKKRQPTADEGGQLVREQFDVSFSDKKIETAITISCFHTNTRLWIQLLGSSTDNSWNEKKKILCALVNGPIVNIIKRIERLQNYNQRKENLKRSINDLEKGVQQYNERNGKSSMEGQNGIDNEEQIDMIFNLDKEIYQNKD